MAAPKSNHVKQVTSIQVWDDTNSEFVVWEGDVTLSGSDIQIGAVEIKNATTDDRAFVDTSGNLAIRNFSQLVPEEHDHLTITYVAAGDGAGEIETVTYRTGGAGGTVVATLTLGYDTSDRLDEVTKT